MTNLHIGDSWGACTLIDCYREPVRTSHGGITETILTTFWKIECHCGNIQTFSPGDFPGKRKLKDCGCGIGSVNKGKPKSAYFPQNLIERVEQFSREQGISFSRGVARLCLDRLDAVQRTTTNKDSILQSGQDPGFHPPDTPKQEPHRELGRKRGRKPASAYALSPAAAKVFDKVFTRLSESFLQKMA